MGRRKPIREEMANALHLEKMHFSLSGRVRVEVGQNLRYVNAVVLSILALNGLHLVL
jgi:hypothetical protein